MFNRTHLLIAGATGLIALGAAAFAQAPAPPPPGAGHMMGMGHKGHMTQPANRAELKTDLEAHFKAMDANHDGTVTPEERKAYWTTQQAKRTDAMFARLDTNKDGAISKAEFVAAHDNMGKRMGQRWGKHRAHEGKDMKKGDKMAARFNQPITETAFVTRGLAMFDKVDTNHDGTISPAEREAARKMMREHRGSMMPPPPPGQ